MVDHTADIARKLGKPVALVISDFVPEDESQFQAVQELRHRCIEDGFAVFPSMGRASRALQRLVQYHRWLAEE
jgi:hypothetical protein